MQPETRTTTLQAGGGTFQQPTPLGNDIFAASCSQADVVAAIAAAQDGDRVIIPNGSCTWTSGFVTTKQIWLMGQSKGNVKITNNAGAGDLMSFTTGTLFSTKISNLYFPSGATGTGFNIHIDGSIGDKPPLVHDNYFYIGNFTGPGAIKYFRYEGGVFWNNTFESLDGAGDPDVTGRSSGSGSGCFQIYPTLAAGNDSWATASKMGTADTTGLNNIYIETNTFNNITLQVIDTSDGARTVIRNNTFNDSAFTSHSRDTGLNGTRYVELYDNTWVYHATKSNPFGTFWYPLALPNGYWYMRGGTGLVTGNLMPDHTTSTWNGPPAIAFIVQQLHRNAGPDACCTGGYPCSQQHGQGNPTGSGVGLEPLYIWGNTGTGNPESPFKADWSPDECGHDYVTFTTANYVQLNRDYYTGTAKPGWTRYQYPHPLTTT